MPDLSVNPLRFDCPTCGAVKGARCDFPDIDVNLRPSHVARYPAEPLYGPSDRCDCGDPFCVACGTTDAHPGFARAVEALTQRETAHDAYRED